MIKYIVPLLCSLGLVLVQPAHASISLKKAQSIALKEYPGTVLESETEEEDGLTVHECEIKTKAGSVYEVEIDAKTGKIIEAELEDSDDNDDDDDQDKDSEQDD